jgi:hypothetical protein
VAARPSIAGAGALAAHVAEAIRGWADRREWRCLPDEPQWLLGAELPEEVIMGVSRPAVLAAAGTPGAVRGMFIDCQWVLDYLGPAAPGGSGGGDCAPVRD